MNTARHLECLVDALAAHALSGDFYLIVQLHHSKHGVGPANHLAVAAGEVLGCGGQPHAVHEWRLQVHQRGGVVGGVDRVIVTRHQRKRCHVCWGVHHCTVHEGTRCCFHQLRGLSATIFGCCDRCSRACSPATNSKALHLGGHRFTVRRELKLNGDNATGSGLCNGRAFGLHLDGAPISEFIQRYAQVNDMIQVDCVEQPLDHRVTIRELART